MKNKLKMGLFTVLSAGMVMFTSIAPGHANEIWGTEKEGNPSTDVTVANITGVDRIKGNTRYDTAIEVSQNGWDFAYTIVLARGDDFADALTSVPLAHKVSGPILLTPSKNLYPGTMEEMERLGVEKVVIVGGEAAINSKVEAAIRKEGIEVTRIAGRDRFETAVLIADMVDPDSLGAVVANGLNFPDALSAAPYAAQAGLPILLTQTNKMPATTLEKLQEIDDPVINVIGGQGVISNKVFEQIPGVKNRLSGKDRFATNIIVTESFYVDNPHMYVATGMNYADALTGAVLAAKQGSGLLLVQENTVPNVVSDYIQGRNLTGLTIFGGKVAVSDRVSKELGKLLQ